MIQRRIALLLLSLLIVIPSGQLLAEDGRWQARTTASAIRVPARVQGPITAAEPKASPPATLIVENLLGPTDAARLARLKSDRLAAGQYEAKGNQPQFVAKPTPKPTPKPAPAPAGTGESFNLYRSTAFSTQATGYGCVAASGQMIWNLAQGQSSHSATQQESFYDYGRGNNAFPYAAAGLDPQGAAAMLNNALGTTAFHWTNFSSLAASLKYAAQRMRATGKAAMLFVGGGAHVWTLNGYTATGNFNVTNVYVSGSLYPKQVARGGYFDLAPNTRLSAASMAGAFYRYSESRAFGDNLWTPWNGYWVVVTA